MDLVTVLGYFGAIVVGLVLGLTGSGGSILTVPIMVYLLGIDPILATAYSLFVVGFTSLVGTVSYMKHGLVHYRTALIFAPPSLILVFLTRKFLIPALPAVMIQLGNFVVSKNLFVMLLFAGLMVAASYSMIKGKKDKDMIDDPEPSISIWAVILQGVGVGTLTGLVGAGGGFIIIPTLVLLGKLDMKVAVGTSLFIISINSIFGFLGDLGSQEIDWKLLFSFSALAAVGILTGSWLTRLIDGSKLKPAFGWFVLGMGIYIFLKELL